MNIDDVIRNRLDVLMKRAGTSKTRLSEDMHKGQNFIRDYLEGVKQSLKTTDLELIAKTLNVTLPDLIGLDNVDTTLIDKQEFVNIEALSAVIEQIETLLLEKNATLPPAKKAKLIALCYKHLYTVNAGKTNVIDPETVRDLISLVS